MKKWKIVAVVALVVVLALTAAGTAFYKYYIVPTYLEPVVNQIGEYLQDENVVEELYDQAVRLFDEGIMDEETYDSFIAAYRTRMEKDEAIKEEKMHQIPEYITPPEGQISNGINSLSAKYASSKVGVELVRINDGYSAGSSSKRYSSERTSERIKADDIVEAEKNVIEEDEASEEEEEDIVKSAYAKLKENMTSIEYSDFIKIMRKLDIDILKTYLSDKEGLKQYLKSELEIEEYKRIVNLGYKYMNLFIEE